MNNSVPDGWNEHVFSNAVTLVYGKSPKDILNEDGCYPVIGTGGITGYTNSYLHEGNTVVIGRKGSINNPSFIDTKFWAIDTTYYVANYKHTDPKWFFYLLQNIDLTKYNEASGVPSLNRDTLYSISYLSPPLPEQQKIAKILTSVDDVIEKTQAQIDKLKDLKTGMMQELLTKGVGVDGKPHTEFKDSPVGRIPKGWEVKPLECVVASIIDCEHKTAPYVEKSEYMVVRTSNVRNGELVFDDMKYTHEEGYSEWTKRAVPTYGDVLFTREAPAGESCLVPANLKVCMGQRMVLLRPNKQVVDHSFFSAYLTSEIASKLIYELSIGTTVSRINIEDIKRINCLVPSLDEQRAIARSLQGIQDVLNKKERKISSLKNTKKALMQDLLTGKVRVQVD